MGKLPVKGWMTYSEVAKKLGLMPQTIRKYVWEGKFEVRYVGEKPMISVESVEEFKKNRWR